MLGPESERTAGVLRGDDLRGGDEFVSAANAEASQTEQLARRAWLSDRRQRFRSGRRYSRFVEAMKIVLPTIACLLIGVLIAYSALYKTPGEGVAFTFSDLKTVGRRVEMTSPTLSYTDKDDRAFVVKAQTATQVPGSTSVWQLATIHATMHPPDKGVPMHLRSKSGHLDSEAQTLDLAGDIEVTSEDGRRFEARSAHVDFGKDLITSQEPVRGSAVNGTIESDRFEMTDSGRRVHFEGNVKFRSKPQG